jgi:hypothetical protein
MWNDGISKELSDYFNSLQEKGQQAIVALQEQIDIEAEEFRRELERTVPKGATLGLLNSLRKARILVRSNWYGYSVEFEGYDKNGIAYQKLANILNYGTSTIKGTRFISRAIRRLKGMDERIARLYENKIKE